MKTLRIITRVSANLWLATLGLSAQAATFINDFTTPFDYVANGIIGDTNWDGVYLNIGDVPNGGPPGNGGGATLIANSGITYPGYLGVRSAAPNGRAPTTMVFTFGSSFRAISTCRFKVAPSI